MNDEEKQLLETERAQRRADLLKLRESDGNEGSPKRSELSQDAPIILILTEMNIRIKQYTQMFGNLSIEHLALQTVQDFKRTIVPLQVKKLNSLVPIAMTRSGIQIYINTVITRDDFSQGGVSYFITRDIESEQ